MNGRMMNIFVTYNECKKSNKNQNEFHFACLKYYFCDCRWMLSGTDAQVVLSMSFYSEKSGSTLVWQLKKYKRIHWPLFSIESARYWTIVFI